MDMPDSTLVMVMTQGIGANLTNDEKRAHLIDLKRERLIDTVSIRYALRKSCRLRSNVTICEASAIIEEISVGYYKASNRGNRATTGQIPFRGTQVKPTLIQI
jgi:hypothetical protein